MPERKDWLRTIHDHLTRQLAEFLAARFSPGGEPPPGAREPAPPPSPPVTPDRAAPPTAQAAPEAGPPPQSPSAPARAPAGLPQQPPAPPQDQPAAPSDQAHRARPPATEPARPEAPPHEPRPDEPRLGESGLPSASPAGEPAPPLAPPSPPAGTRPSWLRRLIRPASTPPASDDRRPRPAIEAGAEEMARRLLADAIRARASDIHLSLQDGFTSVRLRIDGNLLDAPHLSLEDGQRLIRHFKVISDIDPTPLFRPAEAHRTCRLPEGEVDLRITVAPTITGEKLAIRLLPPGRLSLALEDLGLAPAQFDEIQNWLGSIGGLVLIAGPTGSGKTTTLYALLHRLKLLERSVVTI